MLRETSRRYQVSGQADSLSSPTRVRRAQRELTPMSKHEKPDPATGDAQLPPGTPISPREPKGGKHEKKDDGENEKK